MPVSLATAREAQTLLSRYLPVTRLVPAPSLSVKAGADVYLKLETELPTGSFKPRGAIWALSANLARGPVREVVASSTGNHGAAVAYAGKLLGVPATIFLNSNPNPVKRERIAALGAKIFEEGAPDLTAATARAREYSRAHHAYFLEDATDPDLPAGPATIALEIFEQLPTADTIVVNVGDTPLIRGVASAAKARHPAVRIIGVQAEGAPAYTLSWRAGRVIETAECNTIADGLATRTPTTENVSAIRELVDEMVLVSEREMLAAVSHLALSEHLIAEPSGAAGVAALLHGKFRPSPHTVLLITGANISPDVLRDAICSV
jgi:threonine dehydratase